MVTTWACAIARRLLWKDRAGPESAVVRAYEGALEQLREVSRGLLRLPSSAGALPAQVGGFASSSPEAVFDTTGLL
jgi:phage gp36-like protein